MNKKIKKDIEEMVSKAVVTREGLVLKALGGVRGLIGPSYGHLVIRLRDKKEIGMCPETAEKVKTCLTSRERCDFTEEDIREDYTNFRRFVFDFNEDEALITITEGTRYPVIESLQPTPNERRIKVNNAEIVGIIRVINKFLELRERFYAVEEQLLEEIRDFLALQQKRRDKFIRRLANKYKIDIVDVEEVMGENE